MHVRYAKLAVVGLLGCVESRSLAASKTIKSTADRVAARAPAIPTSTLISDFKKDNVSSSWAPGHPKVWASAELSIVGTYVVDVSDDQKFLALAQGSNVTIRDVDAQSYVSSFSIDFQGSPNSVTVLPALADDGGYHVFVNTDNTTTGYAVTQLSLSAEGEFGTGQKVYKGQLPVSNGNRAAFSADRQRFVVFAPTSSRPVQNEGIVYDVNDADATVNLTGHADTIISSSFSHDGALISTAAWDGYGKVWNASTGELLQNLGSSGTQDWLTAFSPDGQYVIVANAGKTPAVKIYLVANMTVDPITVVDWPGWVRYGAWSSDSKLLAMGSYGTIQVYDTTQNRVVQRWEMEDKQEFESYDLTWIEGESGWKLAYRTTWGLEVYDFASNLKYRWGPDDFAQYNGGGSGDGVFVIKSKGWIGGSDADGNVRFYDFPV